MDPNSQLPVYEPYIRLILGYLAGNYPPRNLFDPSKPKPSTAEGRSSES